MINSDGGTDFDGRNFDILTGVRWYRANDPCPTGWRVPTREELQSLYNAGSTWTSVGGVYGRLFGTAPNQIFLPAVGILSSLGNFSGVGTQGSYWSRTAHSVSSVFADNFRLCERFSRIEPLWNLTIGSSVRCVAIIPAESVTLNYTTVTLAFGESATLRATVLPADADAARHITWTSSDNAVASVQTTGVQTNGVVSAMSISGGTATITATADCGFTATAIVTVEGTYLSNSFDGVVIDGTRWATRNVDAPGTFAENPEDAGMFFQWNRRTGWASTGTVSRWDSSIPTGITWESANDPCPTGWRVPTRAELQLLVNSGSVWGTYNGVNGRLYGTAPNRIFLPAAGHRSNYRDGAHSEDIRGVYWSSTRGGELQSSVWLVALQWQQRRALQSQPSTRNVCPLCHRIKIRFFDNCLNLDFYKIKGLEVAGQARNDILKIL